MDIRATTLLNGKTQYKAVFQPPIKNYQDRLREFADALKVQYGEKINFNEKKIRVIRNSRHKVESFIFVG